MNDEIGCKVVKEIGLRIRDADMEAERLQRASTEATTLGDVLAALRRQYIPLLLFALIGVVTGAAHHVTTPKQYYTSATILVDDRRNELNEEITTSIPFVRNDTSFLNEMQVLNSLELAAEVVRRMDLQENDVFLHPPSSLAGSVLSGVKGWVGSIVDAEVEDPTTADPEQQEITQILGAASKLQRDIRIERIGLSFSIDISYIGHDPALASLIVNTYAQAYLADHLSANVESTERTAEWMLTRLEELERRAADIRAEAASLRESDPTQVADLRELALRASTLDALYQTIAARYQEISIQGSFPVTNGRILTQSIVPKTAALPKLWQTLVMTTLLGLIFGFGIAVFRETGERSFRVSTDVHKETGKPFLGHLPRINLRDLSNTPIPKTKEILRGAPSLSGEHPQDNETSRTDPAQIERERRKAIDISPRLFWSVLMPRSLFSSTLRNIHTSVGLGAPDGTCKVVAVTSMLPKEGKTTVAVNYANMLAKSGARTLLIDMDLQGFGMSKGLRIPEGPGIVEALSGHAPLLNAMHLLPYSGLTILAAGPSSQTSVAGDLVYQQNMQALMKELRSHYDYLVLDMPPLGTASDAKAMLGQLDKIVLVCEWGKTPRSLVAQYLSYEPEVAQKVVGVVLNLVDVHKLKKYARHGWPESYLKTWEGAA